MNDLVIMISIKILAIIAFIFILNFWKIRTASRFPTIVYWLLGLIFTLIIPYTIFEWVFNSLSLGSEYVGGLSGLCAIGFYIYIGIKLFKNK